MKGGAGGFRTVVTLRVFFCSFCSARGGGEEGFYDDMFDAFSGWLSKSLEGSGEGGGGRGAVVTCMNIQGWSVEASKGDHDSIIMGVFPRLVFRGCRKVRGTEAGVVMNFQVQSVEASKG